MSQSELRKYEETGSLFEVNMGLHTSITTSFDTIKIILYYNKFVFIKETNVLKRVHVTCHAILLKQRVSQNMKYSVLLLSDDMIILRLFLLRCDHRMYNKTRVPNAHKQKITCALRKNEP